jgi:hypothetical protein|uniref:Uncharacterized protein n=1 Tax=viral metagenome TaxID=1070528 RepID=A0A6C0J1X1_9ZZZZ
MDKEFLEIKSTDDLNKFMINSKLIDQGYEIYTYNLKQLKELYNEKTGKHPNMMMRIPQLIKAISVDTIYTPENLEREIVANLNKIPAGYFFEWLQNNGGYQSTDFSHDTLSKEFLNRIKKSYHKMIIPRNDICDLNLSHYREEIQVENKGIVAHVLSAKKILKNGGGELLLFIVECISRELGMKKIKRTESNAINLSEISKIHKIKQTVSINSEEKLVLFEYDKNILLCQSFNIIEIGLLNHIDFSTFPECLYNYILVCFDRGVRKDYKLYMVEAQPEEIGSKHWNIQSKINDDYIALGDPGINLILVTAGEIFLRKDYLQFNFFSGTIFHKLLSQHCEIVTGLNFDEDSDDQCHYIGYHYFWAPFMQFIFKMCSNNPSYEFIFTEEHLISKQSLREMGLVFDEDYIKKLESDKGGICNFKLEIT